MGLIFGFISCRTQFKSAYEYSCCRWTKWGRENSPSSVHGYRTKKAGFKRKGILLEMHPSSEAGKAQARAPIRHKPLKFGKMRGGIRSTVWPRLARGDRLLPDWPGALPSTLASECICGNAGTGVPSIRDSRLCPLPGGAGM